MHRRVDALLRGHRHLLLGAALVLVAVMAGPAVAGASTDYWVEACGPSAVDDFSFFSSDSANLGGSDSACGASDPAGLSVSDNASGAPEPSGVAYWALSAPAGETIQALYYTGGSFSTSGGGWIAGWQGDNGNGLTPALDPDLGHDCNSNSNTICSTSNAESPGFGPGVGVGPLNQIALAIDCENSPCIASGNSASGVARVELVDPNDTPTVDATVINANVNDGYDSAGSHVERELRGVRPRRGLLSRGGVGKRIWRTGRRSMNKGP